MGRRHSPRRPGDKRPAEGLGARRAPIVVDLGGGRAFRSIYRIATTELHANAPLPQMAPFQLATASSKAASYADSPTAFQPFEDWPLRFRGAVRIGGRSRQLTCRGRGHLAVVRAAGVPDVGIDLECGRIVALADASMAPRLDLLAEVLTGPALALALAGQGIFCLHAGAVSIAGCARVLVGESGVGKSTLVRQPSVGTRLLADDLLPVTCGDVRPLALLPFPQLKLAVSEQPGLAGPSAVPLDEVVVLEPDPPKHGGLMGSRCLPAVEATLALARHTVAAKLFGPALLEQHLAFCADVAAAVPVRSVAFRRDLSRLAALRTALLS